MVRLQQEDYRLLIKHSVGRSIGARLDEGTFIWSGFPLNSTASAEAVRMMDMARPVYDIRFRLLFIPGNCLTIYPRGGQGEDRTYLNQGEYRN